MLISLVGLQILYYKKTQKTKNKTQNKLYIFTYYTHISCKKTRRREVAG